MVVVETFVRPFTVAAVVGIQLLADLVPGDEGSE
jgi:hypothetical protein